MFCREPKSAAPGPPAISLIAIGKSDRPIASITVPVTIGGKYLRIRGSKNPIGMVIRPATI